jgi:hypothetical protein
LSGLFSALGFFLLSPMLKAFPLRRAISEIDQGLWRPTQILPPLPSTCSSFQSYVQAQ